MPFQTTKTPPSDPILDLTTAFRKCSESKKIDLGAGTYRDDDNSPVVFKSVKKVVKDLADETDNGRWFKEYLPMQGDDMFLTENGKLLFGEDKMKTIASIQTSGGTGALRLAMEMVKYMDMNLCNHTEYPEKLKKLIVDDKLPQIHISNPTWPNHNMIIHHADLQHKEYTYYDPSTLQVDEKGFVSSIKANVKKGDGVLLHAIAHNPTGCDVSPASLKLALEAISDIGAVAIIDIAYWGFVSGNLDEDKWCIDMAVGMAQLNVMICQSYSKSMGLYGDRLGVFSMKCADEESALKLRGFMKLMSRGMISSCSRHGSDIAYRLLSTPSLAKEWRAELRGAAERLKEMRVVLRTELEKLTGADWSHITKQKGMFAYTGLKPKQVETLTSRHAIFLAKSGRISISGLNSHNIQKVAEAIADVYKIE